MHMKKIEKKMSYFVAKKQFVNMSHWENLLFRQKNIFKMSLNNKTVGSILTLIEFIFNSSSFLLSFIVLIILLYNLHRKRIKQEDQMSIKLCVNIYTTVWMYTGLLISTNVQSILGDLYGTSFDSISCIAIGYVLLVNLYMFYMAFVNQVMLE